LLTMKVLNGIDIFLRIARCEACTPLFFACWLRLCCPVAPADPGR
jgi:hypothetical protein